MEGLVGKLIQAHNKYLCEDYKQLGLTVDQLATPTVLPCYFDKTFETWLKRLELWGKLRFYYVDPYTKRKKSITKAQFLSDMQNTPLKQAVGDLEFRELHVHSLEIKRTFVDIDGVERVEKYIIEIDLKKELRLSFGKRVLTALGIG